MGISIKVIKGNTRILDNSSHETPKSSPKRAVSIH